jgi:hypothetical protein
MATQHTIEIYSDDSAACRLAIDIVRRVSAADDEIIVHQMANADTAARAQRLGIQSVPAVVIDGKLTKWSRAFRMNSPTQRSVL